VIVVALALAVLITSGCSESTSSGYPERDIEVIIPYSPGGGFDSYVRALAPYIQKHLPNRVNILPINAAGAGGRRGASDTYRAKPDGYTIGIFNLPGVLIPQLQGIRTNYDLFEMTWLSTISKDAYAFVVKGDSPIGSIDAVKELGRPVVYGATGPSSTSYIATTIISEALGIPYEVVTGYVGSSEYLIGVMRGEIDAAFVNLSTASPYLESGDVKMLAVIGEESATPNIPDAADLGIPELNNIVVVRMVGAPPGLPEDIKSILERALLSALDDPGFQDWLEQTGTEAHAAGADATAETIASMARFYNNY
jgi:tripartite-type tricarboxylate transporter receptor subunit TctC